MQQGNPVGLRQLEWYEGKHGAWTARLQITTDANGSFKYRRFADVNSFDWVGYIAIKVHKGKVPVMFTPVHYGAETTWHDSIEAAKLYVEAIFALDND
jgi:hypothetical protein